jgi:hypothetical protein
LEKVFGIVQILKTRRKNKMKHYKIPKDEQEIILRFDYIDKKLYIYVNRIVTYKKLKKLLGEPDKIDTYKNMICSGSWCIDFSDRVKIRKAMNITNYLIRKD